MRTSVTATLPRRAVAVDTAGRVLALAALLVAAGCASAPPAPPVPPGPTFEEKLSAIIQLEDERRLREPPPPAPPPPPIADRRGRRAAPAPPPPPSPPDLLAWLGDKEARVRRRAALAVGRVKLRDGVAPLVAVLKDPDPEVRQMAAFAIGLIGDVSGRDPLIAALEDADPLVKGSAAEALGLIGDPAAADAVARMASELVTAGAATPLPPDEDESRRDTPAAALKLALFSLVRLRAAAPLTSVVLDNSGQPRVRWWPVAYALQRLEDPRAKGALLTLAREAHPYTRAFAVKGLGAVGASGGTVDPAVSQLLVPLVSGTDRLAAVEAIRALGRLGDPAGTAPISALIRNPKADPYLRLEAVAAAGGIAEPALNDLLLDMLADPSPTLRLATLRALVRRDPVAFVTILSGLDTDQDWTVRAGLAEVLGALPPEAGLPRLRALLQDEDQRVIPSALRAVARLNPPDAAEILLQRLNADDPIVRAAAARGLATIKSTTHGPALAEAYRSGQRDTTYVARAAALGALAEIQPAAATATLTEALADRDWAVRVHAATLLERLSPGSDAAQRIRPVPTGHPAAFYNATRLTAPPVSTQFFIETDRGTIHCELAVLDAPLTVDNFVTLARRGFYDGLAVHRVVANQIIQTGDPRGDGDGGPGFTIRDELNQRSGLRGAIAMALDWADTAGSQFFITQAPQPEIDARYTVFGRVLSGMEVVDQLQMGDVIRRVRVWDGTQ